MFGPHFGAPDLRPVWGREPHAWRALQSGACASAGGHRASADGAGYTLIPSGNGDAPANTKNQIANATIVIPALTTSTASSTT